MRQLQLEADDIRGDVKDEVVRMRDEQQQLEEALSSEREGAATRDTQLQQLRDECEQLRATTASSEKQQQMERVHFDQTERLNKHQLQQLQKVSG